MKISLCLFCLLVPGFIFAQIKISGSIKNVQNNDGIAYVNIGIRNKNFGTVSDGAGHFSLQVPDSLSKYNLTFSCVGFEERSVPVLSLKNSDEVNVKLSPATISLSEVTVSNKKPKLKKLGITGYTPMVYTPLYTAYVPDDIVEQGRLIQIDKPAKIQRISMKIGAKQNSADSILLRLNFYAFKDQHPGKRLIEKNIIKRFSLSRDELTFDLSSEDIVFADDFVVGIEYIPEGVKRAVSLRAKLGGRGGFVRRHSLAKWQINQGASPTIFVMIQQ